MAIITITTDFGLRDGYVGVMKGVIWGINQDVEIVDITQLIPPQDINLGGIALQRVVPYFPDNTIHLAVIDPGVGTNRRAMAAKIGSQYFVGPDNGLFTRVIHNGDESKKEIKFVELNKPQYWLKEISHVFHGRDIFSPAAAHLASGISIDEIGTPFSDPILMTLPEVYLFEDKILGEVVSIDNFGNLATNIMQEHLDKYNRKFFIKIDDHKITDFVTTFGDKAKGSLVGLMGTQKDLLIACVNSNAHSMLGGSVGVGTKVEIVFEKR